MRWLAVVAMLMVAGCDPGADAAKRFDMATAAGNNRDACRAATDAVAAYLGKNEDKYRRWKLRQQVFCGDPFL